jgi:diguanylate cyclase (GGDEF)-like protein
MERMAVLAPLPISPQTNAIAIRSEFDALPGKMSDVLALDDSQLPQIGPDAGNETEVALRLALIAMTEAEKRIERQEQRIRELENLSNTDELTRLLNRRGFMTNLHRALAFAVRSHVSGSVIMIDLDRFKSVNDHHGHAAGDALLKAVAESLRHRVRETDSIGRLGGDEFAVLMPGITKEIAAKRMQGLDRELNGRTLAWDGIQIPIGASLGLAHYAEGDDEAAVLNRADEAMYKNKATRAKRGKVPSFARTTEV